MVQTPLESIIIQSTDKDFTPTFMREIGDMTYKLLDLHKFAMYLNNWEDPNRDFISRMKMLPPEDKALIMERSITKNRYNYILSPIKAHIHLKMQKIGMSSDDANNPQFNANVVFEDLAFKMDDIQYRHFLGLLSYLTNFPSLEPFRKYRPNVGPKSDPKGSKWINSRGGKTTHGMGTEGKA
jgi:hypothetical protein